MTPIRNRFAVASGRANSIEIRVVVVHATAPVLWQDEGEAVAQEVMAISDVCLDMFARNTSVRVLRNCTRATRTASTPAIRVVTRRFSSSTASAAGHHGSAPMSHPLVGVASQLDQVAPRFEIDPDKIEILDSPTAFYETLKVFYPGGNSST